MISKYFMIEENKTSIKQEFIAGITTFVTMAYIVVVNPKILEAAGLPFEASMAATILSAFFGTLAMGIYAKRPFAIAPYMGENAFVAYTVVKVLGYSWQTALGAIFISGVLFTLLTLFNIRSWLANSVPESLRISFAVGIGLFLSFIGLNDTGIVKIGVEGAPVHVGNFKDVKVLLGIFSFLLISFLMIKKINGSILIGIILTTVIGIILGETELPEKFISTPPDLSPLLFKLDVFCALQWGFVSIILVVFILDFVDTMGTLIGLGYKANLLDENGNLPEIEKPMLCDSLATCVGALLGTTTTGTYIESATGIQAGGKTGLTAVVTAFMFLTTLFFAPIFSSIPPFAYGSSLIIVGLLMISTINHLKFDKLEEIIPAFVTIVLMSFTYNIGIGMTAGFIVYPFTMLISGRIKEINLGMWILFSFSIFFFIFYPY